MNQITIFKDGERLGPYGMDEARSMVLSGKVLASAQASLDGGQTWLPLHDVPGFATLAPQSPATGAGAAALAPLKEEPIWAGSPSQATNYGAYAAWLLVFAVVGVAAYYQIEALKAYYAAVPLCAADLLWRTLKVRATHYTITTQRVRVTRGLLSKNVQEIELYRVKDTSATQTLYQRLFGLGDVEILSGDAENPSIVLRYVPKALDIRERIRHEVLDLRQRFNVRELDMM